MDSNNQSSIFFLPLIKQRLIVRLRGIILSSSGEISETQKCGRMTFVAGMKPIAFICVKQNFDFIEIGFFKGISLNDPNELLKGKGKEVRRIRIKSEKEIPVLQIKRLIRESIKLQTDKQ